jgi:TPR repeat protein
MAIRLMLTVGALVLVAITGLNARRQEPPPAFSEAQRQAVVKAARSLTASELVDAVRRAEADELEAQVLVAQAFLQTNSPHRDPPRAIPFLEKAAARGHPLAQNALGSCYLSGEGVAAADEGLATLWVRQAVDQGLAQAMYVLGSMHMSGFGVERDVDEAIRLWRAAAEQGNPWGETGLGSAFAQGTGVARDLDAAAAWYRRAALQENPEAQTRLAFMHLTGTAVDRDLPEAARLLRAAAEQGHPVAQFNLAILHLRGEAVPKSREDAAAWLKRASEQGYAAATGLLGQMHWNGELGGDSWTRTQGLSLFEKAASQGYATGALSVAEIHVKNRDHRAACTWLAITRELEQTEAWQQEWAVLRPADAEEVRKALPKLTSDVRKKLTATQLADCEDEARRWLTAQVS